MPETLPDLSAADAAYLTADAEDRRSALEAAAVFLSGSSASHPAGAFGRTHPPVLNDWLLAAEAAYRWLQARDSLKVVAISIKAGKPHKEGQAMATVFDLSDVDEVSFTLAGSDAKGAPVAAPADTWSWTLDDPDSTGAVLTVSTDTTTATVAAGLPDTTGTLTLNVSGATSGLVGAEAILVVASAATAISVVPGTPEPEPAPPAPSA